MGIKASNMVVGGKPQGEPPKQETKEVNSFSRLRAAAKPPVEHPEPVREEPEVRVTVTKQPLERRVGRNINTDDSNELINHHASRYLADMRTKE